MEFYTTMSEQCQKYLALAHDVCNNRKEGSVIKNMKPLLENTCSFFEYVCKQRNDLQATTCLLFPEVRKTLEMLTRTDDCRLVRMSGSGSTCFGLYNTEIKARQAALKISKFEPTFWVKVASLFSSNS